LNSNALSIARFFVIQSGANNFADNMALDEALLEAMPRLGMPVLRFYSWIEPSASFGYFQKYAEVERMTSLRPLVRRPTAGGLVPHDADWTYSLAFPTTHEWYSLTAIQSYEGVHRWIQSAFEMLNIQTDLAPERRRAEAGQCFVGYEKFDVLWRGLKIAGAAQRRTRDGLLIQGSVQPSAMPLKRADWEYAMQEVATRESGVQWNTLILDNSFQERIQYLTRHKYSLATFNQKR
jgi:lipoate-protein ligase A